VSKSNWTRKYAREVIPQPKYTPEHPSARGTATLTRIWNKIRPQLVDRGIVDVPAELPKDVSKWAVMPDWCELMEKHPFTGRNVFKWMDSWVPKGGHSFRNGAMQLRKRSDLKTARMKQEGQGLNDPTPAFTFHGNRMEYGALRDELEREMNRAHSAGEYPNEEFWELDKESMDGWRSVMGGRCGSYVFAESSILFSGMTPHQETATPIPWDVFWESWRESLDVNFPGAAEAPLLQAKHLFVGVGNSSPGIQLQNKDASSGYPGTNMDQEAIRSLINRPKFKGRPTKGVMFPSQLRALASWIKAGMPMSEEDGEEYGLVAQPATLAFRGDRQVDLDLRALGSRGPQQQFHEAADQLAALFPGRSVIIVPTVQVLAQSTWAQPIGNYIAGTASPEFDWVDPWHSSDRLDALKRADLAQGGDKPRASVGADASGWDRDVTSQMHAGEAAWYCALLPEETTLLYVDAELPIDVNELWVSEMLSSLAEGEVREEKVPGMRDDGVPVTITVLVEKLTFNYHEFICKVMSLINHAPICWGDYEVDAPGIELNIDGALERLSGVICSNGGRRSGDAATGIGNSWSNCVVSRSGATMTRDPQYKKLLQRRAQLQGEEPPEPYSIVDLLGRGDDLALVIELEGGSQVPSARVAGAICAIGLRANAKKQEASDVPGKPIFGFANVVVTPNHTGKLLGRTGQRAAIQESMGMDLDTLRMVQEVQGDLAVETAVMTTTSTAVSRLAPLAGFPLMDRHPCADSVVELFVHNDKFRLSYIKPESFDENGQLTEEGAELIARAKDVEATVMARLRAKRENVDIDLEALKEVYLASTVHDLIEDHALKDGYTATRKMPEYDNAQAFADLVSSA